MQRMEEQQPVTAPCEKCGHLVPETNMALHRVTCQHNENNSVNTRTDRGDNGQNSVQESVTSVSNTTSQVEMTICEECGKEIPTMSKVIHDATCHKNIQDNRRNGQQQQQNDEQMEPVPIITGDEEEINMEGTTVEEETTLEDIDVGPATTTATANEEEINNASITEPVEVTQWACPRCTLLNPVQSRQCDACLYTLPIESTSSNPNTNNSPTSTETTPPAPAASPGAIRVEVREIDPRVASAVTSAGNIASWSLFGALLGGPVGAMVGGGTAALFDGITRIRTQLDPERRNRQQQRAVFSSSSIRTTSAGTTTMSITNNVGGRLRRVNIQSEQGFLDQLTPADQRILQMLLLHAMGQNGGMNNVNGMTYDDLFEQFGVPEHHRRRGASQEDINNIGLVNVDEGTLHKLKENQTVCGICLEDFKEGDEMRELDCEHNFHRECIDRWLGQVASCPICKKELNSGSGGSGTSGTASSSSGDGSENNEEMSQEQQQQAGSNHDHID